MTVREAATVLGCTSSHVRNLIAAGRLPAQRLPSPCRPGYVYCIHAASLRAYCPRAGGWPRGKARHP